jgi:SNARE protein 1
MYQRIRHARLLLKNVEVDDHGTSPYVESLRHTVRLGSHFIRFYRASEHRYQRLRATLDQVEAFVTEVEQVCNPYCDTCPLFSAHLLN